MHKFKLIRDLPDERDLILSATAPTTLPAKFSLRSQMAPVLDQGQLGSCGPNAEAGLLMHDMMKQGASAVTPSRLFIYWNTRWLQGHRTVYADTGVSIRTMVQATAMWGWCPESEWPYDIREYRMRAPVSAYKDGWPHHIDKYERVMQTEEAIKARIFAGFPVMFGMQVYESIYKTGSDGMYVPAGQILGGHATLLIGWDDDRGVFEDRNSWGAGFGDQGNFFVPKTTVLDPQTCQDFWTITFAN